MPEGHAPQNSAAELRHLGVAVLRTRAEELLAQIAGLRFRGPTKEKNVKKLRTLRHQRARVLTILGEKEAAGGTP